MTLGHMPNKSPTPCGSRVGKQEWPGGLRFLRGDLRKVHHAQGTALLLELSRASGAYRCWDFGLALDHGCGIRPQMLLKCHESRAPCRLLVLGTRGKCSCSLRARHSVLEHSKPCGGLSRLRFRPSAELRYDKPTPAVSLALLNHLQLPHPGVAPCYLWQTSASAGSEARRASSVGGQ